MAKTPERVKNAQQLIAQQRKQMAVMLTGVFIALASMLMFGVNDAKNLAVAAMVTMLGWLFANLVWMGRKEQEVASAQKVLDAYEHQDLMRELHAEESPAPNPDDPRWEPVLKLIDRIRTLGATDAVKVTANQAETQLRHVLLDLDALAEAQAAEAALGSHANSPRQERLADAHQQKQAAADTLIEAVRDLHVALAVQDSADTEPLLRQLQQLLHQAEAEHEVDGLDEAEQKRRLARAAQRTRS